MNRPIDASKFETGHWTLYLNVKLTDEEMGAVSNLTNSDEHVSVTWDEELNDFSLPGVVWCVKQVRPEAEAADWEHVPLNIYVRGLYLPAKVFEIEGAMSLKEAKEAAKSEWKDQYHHLGLRATIVETRLATDKDMKRMYEIKEDAK